MTSDPTPAVPDIDALPRDIAFQVFGGCDLRCVMCAVRPGTVRDSGPMDMDIYRTALDELHGAGGVEEVCLSLQCEPLLDPYLFQRIAYAKSLTSPPAVTLSTNAVGLSPGKLNALLAADLDRLNVSLNAYSHESFQTVCGRNVFGTVADNIANLLTVWGERPGLSITTMVCSVNSIEVLSVEPDIIRRAREMGVPIGVSPISNHCGWLEDYEKLAILTNLQSSTGKLYCGDIFEAFYVLVDGAVISCCGDIGAGETLGKIPEDRLLDLWSSNDMYRRRQMILDGRYDELTPCRYCSQAQNICARRAHLQSDEA